MTLSEASDLTTPILQSQIFKTSKVLQDKVEEIAKMFKGFKCTNPFGLNQFEILDAEKEASFRDLIATYEDLCKQAVA